MLRDRTGWIELVENSWVKLIDVDIDKAIRLLRNPLVPMKHDSKLLGDGRAADKITEIIKKKH